MTRSGRASSSRPGSKLCSKAESLAGTSNRVSSNGSMRSPPNPPSHGTHQHAASRNCGASTLGPDHRVDGLRVTSAELYDDCTIVRWHLTSKRSKTGADASRYPTTSTTSRTPTPRGARRRPRDGVRTPTTDRPHHARHLPPRQQPAVLPGGSVFTPAVPHRATQLSVYLPTGQVRLDLDTPPTKT